MEIERLYTYYKYGKFTELIVTVNEDLGYIILTDTDKAGSYSLTNAMDREFMDEVYLQVWSMLEYTSFTEMQQLELYQIGTDNVICRISFAAGKPMFNYAGTVEDGQRILKDGSTI